jgi:hypothetical protein
VSCASPALSVILVVPDRFDGARKALEHLRAQTVRDRIELVLVVAADAEGSIDRSALAGFAASRVVTLDRLASRAHANAAGAREARGPILAFAEEHGFPDPGWAEALLRRHDGPWAAVGPRLRNANPATLVSWGDLFVNYHSWLSPSGSGPAARLPGHHTSYKRDALSAYGDDLVRWLDVESELHREMSAQGLALFFEAEAEIAHVNVSRWGPWLAGSFHAGRVYAAARARDWSRARRLLYAGAWPLLPLVRLARLLASWPQVEGMPGPLQLAPRIAVAFLADGAGQGLGYLTGSGASTDRLARFELGRVSQLSGAEGATLLGAER